ncbi:MAG: methyltransferase domain-containing protein [Candidatus Daviesbacteria bacterium]|nr:methyltransferase domain-containing protein [Candidatus Daviesbacteria bacterium]
MKRVEFHTHTKFSSDSITNFKDIIETCQKKGIDVLIVTDHNQIEGALRLKQIAPFEVIVGEEILTKDGEIIGLFLKKLIPSGLTMKETMTHIKRQGGIVYLPHPYDKTTRRTSIRKNIISDLLSDIDIVETYNGRTILPWDNKSAQKLALRFGKITAVGSDAHTKFEYGRNYLEMNSFNNNKEFLESLNSAKKVTSPVLYWIFILTKWARFVNKQKSKKVMEKVVTDKECNLCGGISGEIIYKKRGKPMGSYKITDNSYGVHHQIVRCLGCGLVFADPIDKDKKIVERYKYFKDPEYEAERIGRGQNQKEILNNLNNMFPNKGKLLDVGCATGAFLESAKNDGWDVLGIEPSKWATDVAKNKYTLPVLQGTIDSLKIPKKSFDVVVCLDVIEHVISPRKLLKSINKVLKPDGLLCLVTPDKDSLLSRVLGENWWHVRPDHIFYFSESSINLLLQSEGFDKNAVKRYSWTFSFDYWISRFNENIPFIYTVGLFFKKIPILNYFSKRRYGINFRDSLELYYRKN